MKKLISLLLSFCLIMSVLPVYASAAGLYEVENSVNERALELVEKLGILDTASSSTDVTRAEFVSAAVKMFGMDTSATGIGNVYDDVTSVNPAYNDIAVAYGLNWISPSPDRNFYPDSPIRKNEAVKILLCAMQYRDRAELSGGFPSGYMSLAIDLKLLKNVMGGGDFLTRSDAAMLIYNTLHAYCPQVEGVTTDYEVSYEVGSDTVMEAYFDMYLMKAQVVSVGITNLYGQKNTDLDNVQLKRVSDGKIFDAKDADRVLSDHAGEQMEVYLRYDSDMDTYNCVAAYPYRQSVEIYDGTEISNFVREADNFHFYTPVADSDGETEDEKVKYSYKSSITVLLNDMYQYDIRPVFEILKQEDTEYSIDRIKIIDINDDNVCDILSVYAYKNYIADSVDALWEKVRIREGIETLDINRDIAEVLDPNGNEVISSYIMRNSVLSVFERPADEKLIKSTVYVSNKYVDGIIDEIDTDKQTVTASGIKLSFAANAKNAFSALTPGYEYRFFTDFKGLVSSVQKSEISNDLEGYFVIDKYALEAGGISKELQMRVFDIKKGDITMLKATKKVEIDGTPYSLSNDSDKIDGKLAGKTLVYMKLSSNGEIRVIKTPSKTNEGSFRYARGTIGTAAASTNEGVREGTVTMSYRSTGSVFAKADSTKSGAYSVNVDPNRTKVVLVPLHTCDDEEKRMKVYKNTVMSYFTNNTSYDVQGYVLNEHGVVADILVAYRDPDVITLSSTDSGTGYFVVDHVVNARNFSGDFGKKVVGYLGKQPRSYISSDTEFKTKSGETVELHPGDVFCAYLDVNDEVNYVNLVYCHAEEELKSPKNKNSYTSSNRVYSGIVYDVDGNAFSVVEDSQVPSLGSGDDVSGKLNSYGTVGSAAYYFNPNEEKGERVRLGTTADMKSYVKNQNEASRVVVHTVYTAPKMILIIDSEN